jgi:hypothetical protein
VTFNQKVYCFKEKPFFKSLYSMQLILHMFPGEVLRTQEYNNKLRFKYKLLQMATKQQLYTTPCFSLKKWLRIGYMYQARALAYLENPNHCWKPYFTRRINRQYNVMDFQIRKSSSIIMNFSFQYWIKNGVTILKNRHSW